VVTGWRTHVLATLDTLSSARRPLQDPARLQAQLLAATSDGPMAFRDLVEATDLPAVARPHALHLLWRRRLGVDLVAPLGDASTVWPICERAAR